MQIPGMPNWWLMPIETRIGMLTTGMRGKVGLKLLRLATWRAGVAWPPTSRAVLRRTVPGHLVGDRRARARRASTSTSTSTGEQCARYGLTVGDVQDVIETAIGGMTITTAIEGRSRLPVKPALPARAARRPPAPRPDAGRDARRARRSRCGELADDLRSSRRPADDQERGRAPAHQRPDRPGAPAWTSAPTSRPPAGRDRGRRRRRASSTIPTGTYAGLERAVPADGRRCAGRLKHDRAPDAGDHPGPDLRST